MQIKQIKQTIVIAQTHPQDQKNLHYLRNLHDPKNKPHADQADSADNRDHADATYQ